MTRAATGTSQARIVAALHRAHGVWRAVAATRTNGSIQVIDAREFTRGQHGHIGTWLDQQQVDRVVGVLPASRIICRTAKLPDASFEQLASALQLQADTWLPDVVPPHRRAMGVLPKADGEGTRSGLIVAWPPRAEKPEIAVDHDITWTADVACLAALIGAQRLDEPVVFFDRDEGSIALALPGADGITFRAAQETSATAAEWSRLVEQLVAETALTGGQSDEYAEAMAATVGSWLDEEPTSLSGLLLPDGYRDTVRAHVEGAPNTSAWWSKFGICIGAVLAMRDSLAPLTELRDEAPVHQPGSAERLAGALARPRTAAVWLIAALVMIGLGPLAFSGLKLLTLYQKVGPLEEFERQRREREMRLDMYQALGDRTWPMQKLLADVGNCAPPGIVFNSIALEESNGTLNVEGETDSQELVIDMVRAMRKTGIFDEVKSTYSHRDQGKPKFSVSAQVANAYHRPEYEDDFAETTLAMRLYPNEFRRIREFEEQERESRNESAGGSPVIDEDQTTGAERIGRGPGGEEAESPGNGASPEGNEFGRTGPRSVRPRLDIPALAQDGENRRRAPDIPEPLSDEELAEMSRASLINAIARVRRSQSLPGLTDEQRETLEQESDRLLRQLRNLPRR